MDRNLSVKVGKAQKRYDDLDLDQRVAMLHLDDLRFRTPQAIPEDADHDERFLFVSVNRLRGQHKERVVEDVRSVVDLLTPDEIRWAEERVRAPFDERMRQDHANRFRDFFLEYFRLGHAEDDAPLS